jgi:RNA 3'-terminal phosphate cyclase (ATP)
MMLVIDGSQGEGGGQVLRTCLSLAAITGRSFQINRIRANRSRPGLRPQHLTGVRAVAALVGAELEGDDLDATSLTFRPTHPPRGGEYAFDVSEAAAGGRSAGAVTLIVQAILWPLVFADGPSQVVLGGGTFVPYSPPYHYLAHVARPVFERLGVQMACEIERWGWMPAGGGRATLSVWPSRALRGAEFERASEGEIRGLAAVTNLPSHIPHRMARRAYNLLAEAGVEAHVDALRERGDGPGAGIVLWLAQAGFSALGRVGLPAEEVAEAVVAELLTFMDNPAAVDHHLADQLLLPLALAHGRSRFTTNRLTEHTLTNIDLLRRWLDVPVRVSGVKDSPGEVVVDGIGLGQG